MNNFWFTFIENHRFTKIVILTLILFGFFSTVNIQKESRPEVNIPVATVITVYPGASPLDVEELITNKIEDKIIGIDNLEKITSTSSEGVSSIVVEFDIDASELQSIVDLRDKVDEVKRELPGEAEEPVVTKISFEDEPFYTFVLGGPYEVSELKSIAEDLETELLRINGVSDVSIIGGVDREIKIVVNKAKLDQFGISISEVTSAIRNSDTDLPVGSIETGGENFKLRFGGRVKSADEIKEIPIRRIGSTIVSVQDVATVIDGFTEKLTKSYLSVGGKEVTTSVTMQIKKVSGADILRTVDKIKIAIESSKGNILPNDVDIEVIEDFGEFIQEDLNGLVENGIQTMIIVFISLFIFIGLRESLLAALSIPLTFLITFIFLYYLGYTLNFLTLFSLILALGLLVDNSIVVIEGMHKYILEGKKPLEAAELTVKEFNSALFAGTLTTVFAFIPMLLVSGIMGEFIKSIPITVSIVLLSSLFVGLGVITTIGGSFLKEKDDNHEDNLAIKKKAVSWVANYVDIHYPKLLDKFVYSKTLGRNVAIGLVVALIFAMMLPGSSFLPVDLFPDSDQEVFTISFDKPVGTVLEDMESSMKETIDFLYTDERIESFQVSIGSQGASSDIGSSNSGRVIVSLKDLSDRDDKSYEIIDEYSNILPNLTDADVNVFQRGEGPESGAPVVVQIFGEDIETLENLSLDLKELVKSVPGTRNVETSVEETNGEFVIEIDRQKAGLYGVNTTQVALALRNAVAGSDAIEISRDGDDIDVLVKYALNPSTFDIETGKTNIADISRIKSLTINTPTGEIPLSLFTNISLESSRSNVLHENGQRVVSVSSYIADGKTSGEIFAGINSKLPDFNLPDGYEVKLGGENEDTEQSFRDLIQAMVLAILLIFALLVFQFKSYRQPLFVVLTIPMSLIGVFPGLALIGLPLSFPGVIGVVALAGIVVNDAIILVDNINRKRNEGLPKREAVIEGGRDRIQPIILTTITTVGGVLPLALTNETWGPIGFSIMFGLLAASILTPLMIPYMYDRFGDEVLD